jgi:hypothetical protein
LVDTWSASAAGAFAFIENGLYTVEAWKTLLSHLTPGAAAGVFVSVLIRFSYTR